MYDVSKKSIRPFTAFWTGQSLALLGGNVAGFALPTVAIALLGASAAQIAVISALQALAFPVLGMIVAALVERHRKRLAMAYADALRFAIVLTVPALFLAHRLNVAAIGAIAVATAVLGVVRDIAAQAYVPHVLEPEKIAGGNARLELSNTAAQSLGPAVGGVLMHTFAAPFALLVDAFSYLGSALTLLFVGDVEDPKKASEARASVKTDVLDGLRFVLHTGGLSRIALCTATLNAAAAIGQVVSLIFFYRTLHLSPLLLGVLFALSNVGFAGVFFAPRLEERLGMLGTLCSGVMLLCIGRLVLPFAAFGWHVAIVGTSLLLTSAATPIYNIVQLSYRQRITPLGMQARMHATMRTINSMATPLGAGLGGVLAGRFGITQSLTFAGVLTLCALGWLLIGGERLGAERTASAA